MFTVPYFCYSTGILPMPVETTLTFDDEQCLYGQLTENTVAYHLYMCAREYYSLRLSKPGKYFSISRTEKIVNICKLPLNQRYN